MVHFLPGSATIAQACKWLAEQTGEPWTLARILEAGTMPWFWLDYSDKYGTEVFSGRKEGYLAPMVFVGDSRRLEVVGRTAMVTMTRTADDRLMQLEPAMPVALDELRFMREDIESVGMAILEARARASAPVKWQIWLNASEVRLWESVALICDIEPTSLAEDPNAWQDARRLRPYLLDSSFPSQRIRQRFDDALLLAERSATVQGPIRLASDVPPSRRRMARVSLVDVLAFFVRCNWSGIPAELAALIGNPSSMQTDAAEPPTAPVATFPFGEAAAKKPTPLTTSQVAASFDGLRYSAQGWKKPLGDKPKWLGACVAMAGIRGVRETQWNPVLIGGALVRRGYVKANSVRGRFQSRPDLKPWLDEWKSYEADHFDSD
ncbi:MAG: hypothetical protein U1E77_14305 [Inhella sp.]